MFPSKRKTLSLFHPFSPTAVGLDEDTIPQFHSQPHIAALRHLSANGWTCYADYLSTRRLAYRKADDGVTWRFWPVSRTWRNKRRRFRFRSEQSYWALANMWVNPPDVVVINMSAHTSRMTQALAKAIRYRHRKYIAMLGGINYTDTPEVIDYYLQADMVITHTRWQRDYMLSMPHYSQLDISVLPLGVDCEQFAPAPKTISLGNPGLLFVGRWQKIKGIHHAVDALGRIKQHFSGAKLHIIGPVSDKNYEATVKKQIMDAGLEDAVICLGPLKHRELPKFFQSADFLLLPSVPGLESFGMVIIESMACGTPVVALRAEGGGPNEIISHNEDGLLVDAVEIPSAILQIWKHPSWYRQMRTNARQKAVQQYSVQVTQRLFEEMITRVSAFSD